MSNELKFNSDKVFLKNSDQEITFKEFKKIVKKIATELEKRNLNSNDLVLLDIRNPFYLAAYIFACFHLKTKPALLSSFFKKNQMDSVLKNNSYSLFITDQKNINFNV